MMPEQMDLMALWFETDSASPPHHERAADFYFPLILRSAESASRRITTNGIRLLLLTIIFCVIPFHAMQMPPRKIILRTTELRSAGQLMLKERALISLMPICGIECMRLLNAPVDLINFNTEYVAQCCSEIEDYANMRYPKYVPKDPPAAAPLHKVITSAHEKKRFDILQIIVEKYYAPIQWPALCLLARAGYADACSILLDLSYTDANCVDHMARTPLMNAALYGQEDVVALLLERNDIDLLYKGRCNKDACQLAKDAWQSVKEERQKNKYKSIILLLENSLENKKTKRVES